MIFLIYTILVILQQCKGISTVVPDPCPRNIQQSIAVVDMCMPNSATEDKQSGSDMLDSVLLRIIIQQDDCICRVNIENQIQLIHVGLVKYGDFTDSAPEKNGCGLAVDINHIPDASTGNVIAPIECIENVNFRSLQLLQNSTLRFKSRIINGSFTRGYCMRIQRDSSTDSVQVLQIDCEAPLTTEHTTTISTQATESVISSTMRTTGDVTITDPTTDTSKKFENPPITTDPTTGIEQTIYIGIGAVSGVALLLLVVLVVVCLRRKSTQNAGTSRNVRKSYQQDKSDDKLPDNVLYVPAGEFDIAGGNNTTADVDTTRSTNERLIVDCNYSTVDDDMPKSSNEGLSVEGNYSTVDEDIRKSSNKILSMEGNYSTVDVDTPRSSNKKLSIEGNYSPVNKDTAKSSNKRLSPDGNYSTVELAEHLDTNSSYLEHSERRQTKGKVKPTIKPKPKSSCINSEANRSSDQSIRHIIPPNGSDSVYAIVDKSSKNVPTTNGDKGEGIYQPDQTYAVVDKSRKRKSSQDETNKKEFEINSGNRV